MNKKNTVLISISLIILLVFLNVRILYYSHSDFGLGETRDEFFLKFFWKYIKYENLVSDFPTFPEITEIKFNNDKFINSIFDNCLYTLDSNSISFVFLENDWTNFDTKYRDKILSVVKHINNNEIEVHIFLTNDKKFKRDVNYKLMLAYSTNVNLPGKTNIIKTATGNGNEPSESMYLIFEKNEDEFSDSYLNNVFTIAMKRFFHLNY